MPINLNAAKYGEQFNAFVNFASKQTNPNYIARIEKPRPEADLIGMDGMPRTITAKTMDGYGQFLRGSGSRKVNNEVRDLFLKTILGVCGVDEIEQLPQGVQDVLKLEDFNGKGHPLTARRIKAVTDAVQTAAGLTVAGGAVAFGTSPAVEKIQHMALNASGLPPDADPEKKMAAFYAKLSENAAREIAVSVPHLVCKQLAADGKMNLDKAHQQFKIDLERDMKVSIEGRESKAGGINGNVNNQLPKNFEVARDEIVRFITGENDDTFEAASESVKRQTYVLMSFINQYTSTAVTMAFQSTIKGSGAVCLIAEDSDLCKAGTGMSYTLSKTGDGDIHISCEQAIGIKALTTADGVCFLNYDTSCCHIGIEINLSSDSLNEVANGDWTKFDYEAFHAEGNDGVTDRQIDLIPAKLRLDTNISASMNFEVYAPKPHQDPYNPNYVPPHVPQGV